MNKTLNMTLTAIFVAIIIVFSITPIGYIGLPGLLEFTTIHLVVISGSCLMGYLMQKEKKGFFFPYHGLIFGTTWGIFSMIIALFSADPVAQTFRNPLVSVLPRMIAGTVCGFGFLIFNKKINRYIVQGLVVALIAFSAIYSVANGQYPAFAFILVGATMIVIGFLVMTQIAKRKRDDSKREIYLNIATTASFATLINTVLVLFTYYLFFSVAGNDVILKDIILGAISINVIIEQMIAIIIVPPVTMALISMHKKIAK